MRIVKRIIALLVAAALLIPALVSAGAITVVHNGKEYILRSHTPTTGDIKVLMVRVGFADYPADADQKCQYSYH